MKLVPDWAAEYVKGWASFLGACITAVAVVSPLPKWCTIAAAILGVVLVVMSPKNAEKLPTDPPATITADDVDDEEDQEPPADTVQPVAPQPVKRATRKPRAPAKKAAAKKSTS